MRDGLWTVGILGPILNPGSVSELPGIIRSQFSHPGGLFV